MKFKLFLFTTSVVTPLFVLPLVVSCGESATSDNSDSNDSQNPSIKYIPTTARGQIIDIMKDFNLDKNTINSKDAACNYLANNKNWVIEYKDILFRGETQFLISEDQIESIETTQHNSSFARIIVNIKVKPNSIISENGEKNTTTTTFTFNNFYYYN